MASASATVMPGSPEDYAFADGMLDPRALGAVVLGRRDSRDRAVDVARITAPSLVYVGEQDDVDAVRSMADVLGVSAHILPGADHEAGFMASDQVLPLVEEFLRTLPAA